MRVANFNFERDDGGHKGHNCRVKIVPGVGSLDPLAKTIICFLQIA